MHCDPLERSQRIVDNSAFLECPYFSSHLDQEQVRLTVKPVGGKGQVGVLVHLAAELWPDARPESVSELRLEFLTSYEQLRTFSDDLRRAVQGDLDVATLNGEVLR